MAFPQTPYLLYGAISGITSSQAITAINKNTLETQAVTSESDGTFVVDCANFLPLGYSDHDVIELAAAGRRDIISVNAGAFPEGREFDLEAVKSGVSSRRRRR